MMNETRQQIAYRRVLGELTAAGITKAEIADVVGVTAETVRSQLRGHVRPRADLALVIARVTDIPLEVLIDPSGSLRARCEALMRRKQTTPMSGAEGVQS